jgi:iron complex outermembrane recepter protein
VNTALRNELTAAGIVPGPNNREVNLNGEVFINQEVYGGSVNAEFELPANVTLTSITALRYWDTVDNNDADQRVASILDTNGGDSRQKQLSQEIRLSSTRSQEVDWVVGFFYFDQNYDLQNTQLGTFNLPVPPNSLSRQTTVLNDTTNIALFGDVTWQISDQFSVFGGMRYTAEQLETKFIRVAVPGTRPVTAPLTSRVKQHDDAWSWRAGAQFHPSDDISIYGSVARGYKGGGFNALIDSTVIREVKPEIPTSYEIGIKSELFDRKVRLNVAAFRTNFKNFQAQAVSTDPVTNVLIFDVVNAGSLRTQGVEADFSIRPLAGLKIDGGMAYTDASYTDFATAPCYFGQTSAQGCVGTGTTARQDLTGRSLANAPKFTANGSVRYETPISDSARVFGQLSYAWRGDAYTALDLDPRSKQGSYGLVDAQLGVSFNDSIRVWVWGKNLTDEYFAETIFDTPLDNNGQSQYIPVTADRQFGLTVEASF